MPTLTLRSLGMSHLVEGFSASGLDGRAMLDALSADHGAAVAPLGSADAPESILIDRKAAPWGVLRDWLAEWVGERGYAYVSWADDALASATKATLHFHE